MPLSRYYNLFKHGIHCRILETVQVTLHCFHPLSHSLMGRLSFLLHTAMISWIHTHTHTHTHTQTQTHSSVCHLSSTRSTHDSVYGELVRSLPHIIFWSQFLRPELHLPPVISHRLQLYFRWPHLQPIDHCWTGNSWAGRSLAWSLF